jgi:hypothetical protein
MALIWCKRAAGARSTMKRLLVNPRASVSSIRTCPWACEVNSNSYWSDQAGFLPRGQDRPGQLASTMWYSIPPELFPQGRETRRPLLTTGLSQDTRWIGWRRMESRRLSLRIPLTWGSRFQPVRAHLGFFDPANNLRVIINTENGTVVTVIPAGP